MHYRLRVRRPQGREPRATVRDTRIEVRQLDSLLSEVVSATRSTRRYLSASIALNILQALGLVLSSYTLVRQHLLTDPELAKLWTSLPALTWQPVTFIGIAVALIVGYASNVIELEPVEGSTP